MQKIDSFHNIINISFRQLSTNKYKKYTNKHTNITSISQAYTKQGHLLSVAYILKSSNNIEQHHIPIKNKHADKIIYWHLYFDDIIIRNKGNKRQITSIHSHIHKIHKILKFTLEIEQNHSINFIDLTIIKTNKEHIFKINRNPNTTDKATHNTSNHLTQHKHKAFKTLTHTHKHTHEPE